MKNSFAVHYQTWKNEQALQFVLENFRKYFSENPVRVVSDAGADFSKFSKKYNFDFEWCEINTLPMGKMAGVSACYEWLSRVNDTCLAYDTDWVVIFEDDVLTQNDNIIFPKEDSAGFIVWPWKNELANFLASRNTKNKNWGYGMCGGSIFKRDSFINSYIKIEKFNLYELAKLDGRIITHTDTLINCFLQFFGYSYQTWDCLTDMLYPNIEPSKTACFAHGYKNLY